MCICKAGAGQALCEGGAVRLGNICALLELFLVCSMCFWTRGSTGPCPREQFSSEIPNDGLCSFEPYVSIHDSTQGRKLW